MRSRNVLLAAATALAIAACTGGGGDGGTPGISVRAGDFGGVLVAVAGAPGAAGQVQLIDQLTGGNADEMLAIEFETDECLPPEAETGTAGEPVFSYLDVGAEVTMSSGAFNVALVKDTSGGSIAYFGQQTGSAPLEATWTFANSGTATVPAGTLGSVQVPTALDIDGGDITSPGSDFEVTWTGGVGANYIDLSIYDGLDELIANCAPRNDGSFTIPAAVTSSAGAGGYYEISAFRYETTTFRGKTVVRVGFGI